MRTEELELNEYVSLKDATNYVKEIAEYYGGIIELRLINHGWPSSKLSKLITFINSYDLEYSVDNA